MSDTSKRDGAAETSSAPVTVRYWAAARAAAGRESDGVEAGSLDAVLSAARDLHAGDERYARVVAVCSILVGETPVGAADHATIMVPAGATVELLPPFAGGDDRYSAGGASQ